MEKFEDVGLIDRCINFSHILNYIRAEKSLNLWVCKFQSLHRRGEYWYIIRKNVLSHSFGIRSHQILIAIRAKRSGEEKTLKPGNNENAVTKNDRIKEFLCAHIITDLLPWSLFTKARVCVSSYKPNRNEKRRRENPVSRGLQTVISCIILKRRGLIRGVSWDAVGSVFPFTELLLSYRSKKIPIHAFFLRAFLPFRKSKKTK